MNGGMAQWINIWYDEWSSREGSNPSHLHALLGLKSEWWAECLVLGGRGGGGAGGVCAHKKNEQTAPMGLK